MPNIEIAFSGRDEAFSVRRFRLEQRLSAPFQIVVTARCELDDVDLDALIGSVAVFTLARPMGGRSLVWNGVCSHAELVQAEPTGLSTYVMTVTHALSLLAHRTACRVFRRMSAPAIVTSLLAEWNIEVDSRVDATAHPELDYRVQYNESDLAFIARTLEEAGITYLTLAADDHVKVVLSDRPTQGERVGDALPFFGDVTTAHGGVFVTHVARASVVRSGSYRARDYDFMRPSFDLRGDAGDAPAAARRERYDHAPGRSQVVAPGRTGQGADATVLAAVAQRRLDAVRADARTLAFETNVLEVEPGEIRSISGHPRSDISSDTRLLVLATSLEGTDRGGHEARVRAVFADQPYRPSRATPRPWIGGVQSATVVGPPGEEIHVDESGRVRVLFPWDQQGARGDGSSCWVRVSHGWAGSGFGVVALPRVGDEVLVSFVDGDPDLPVVVGRLFNAIHASPYRLPEERATTGIRTRSTPGGGGYNELRFDDAAGAENVHLRAQRTFDEHVGSDHATHVGGNRALAVEGRASFHVAGDRQDSTGASRTDHVAHERFEGTGGSRTARVEGNDTTHVRGHKSLRVEGTSSLTLDGPASISTDDVVSLVAGKAVSISVGQESEESGSLHARGSWLVGADREIVLSGTEGISLRCGATVIRVTPDSVEIATKRLVVRAEDQIDLRGDKALIELAAEARVAAPAVRAFGEGSSLELTADASMKGAKVKLMHRDGDPPNLADDDPARPATRPLSVRLVDAAHQPFAGKPFELVADGVRYTGTTDGDGRATQALPTTAERCTLVLWVGDAPTGEHHAWSLAIAEPPATSTLDGVRSRLTNLGYSTGRGEALDAATARAILEFQERNGLEATGQLDGATISHLEQMHGH